MVQPREKINELIKDYIKAGEQISKLEQEQHFIRELVKDHMKSFNIDSINEEGNVCKLSKQTRETVDKDKIKVLLTPQQYNDVIKKTEFEVLRIMTERSFKNMKHFYEDKK